MRNLFSLRIVYNISSQISSKNAFEILNNKSYKIGVYNLYRGRIAAMFGVNDVIIYGAQGVCKITGIEEKNVGGEKKDLFCFKACRR